jgi:hypothetical protein
MQRGPVQTVCQDLQEQEAQVAPARQAYFVHSLFLLAWVSDAPAVMLSVG